MIDDLIMNIAQYGVAFAVLALSIYYFLTKEKCYKKEIADLNQELRKSERESLELMSKLTTTLDKLIDSDSRNKDEILAELRILKETLSNKIDNLK